MIDFLVVVVAIDYVGTRLDVRHFARDGVDHRTRPTIEVGRNLGGIDTHGAGRPVDGQWAGSHTGHFDGNAGDLGFQRAASIANGYRAVPLNTLMAVDRHVS
jgi:hypothetical protein